MSNNITLASMKFRYYFSVLAILLLVRCAHEAAPTGGAKDNEPPKLLRANPLNESRNFHGKRIKLQFDEYLAYALNVAEIQVTPEIKPAPTYYVSGKTLVVQLPKTLDSNITYNIQFGDAIKDINEGNILHDATFCFSTGDSLDVCMLSGGVIALKDLKPVESVLIGLYKDTGEFVKPIYFTKTTKAGTFIFRNVKKGNYRIAGFEDKNLNRQYDAGDGQSGFIDGVFTLTDTVQNIQLNLFPQYKGKILDEKISAKNKLTLAFTHVAGDVKLLSAPLSEIEFVQLNPSRDTLTYWYRNSADSISFSLINGDSLTTFLIKNQKENDTLRITDKGILVISPLTDLEINFSNPLRSVDKNRLTVFEDSITPISSDKIILSTEATILKIGFPKTAGKNYFIEWQDSCVTDIFGYCNLAQKTKVSAGKESEYGNLILKKSQVDADYLLVELLNSAGDVMARKTLSPEAQTISFLQLPKGNYAAIGTIDANNNGYWDGGNLEQGIQPEKRVLLNGNIELKGGWEVEAEIDLSGKQSAKKERTVSPAETTGKSRAKSK